MLGSWWAYYELGWGGWWFWDPVENASFMPWLVGTALIHSLAVTEKQGLFRSWTVLLTIAAFSLSLWVPSWFDRAFLPPFMLSRLILSGVIHLGIPGDRSRRFAHTLRAHAHLRLRVRLPTR